MPTSAHKAAPLRVPPRVRSAGFTLIELLVVMVLLGLMAGLALPAMQRWFDAVQAKAHAAGLVDAMRAAAFAAGATRQERIVDAASFATDAASSPASASTRVPLQLPPGWKLVRAEPATFLASGLCKPGRVVLEAEAGRSMALVVHGPVCRVELADGAAASP